MRNATTYLLAVLLAAATPALAQKTDFVYAPPPSSDPTAPFSHMWHIAQFNGSMSVTGPFDLDGDGKAEVLLADFTGGQRVHVFEVQGPDDWRLVYSTPYHATDVIGSPRGARHATGADLDGDGHGEIIFVSGHNWAESEEHPLADRNSAMFIFEHTGADDDYGAAPAVVFGPESFGNPAPNYVKSDNFSAVDVDGDGRQELLWPNDASSPWDEWYVFSIDGEIGSGFETLVAEMRLTVRNHADAPFDPVDRGGGSTYAVNAADLDGDGSYELSLHAWNNLNFSNADVLGPDSYQAPGDGAPNIFLQAAGNDDLSWFNGVAVDINGDGDDEVFYPREYGFQDNDNGNRYEYVSVLNYEPGEDPMQITTDQFRLDLVGPLTAYGIVAGDLNDDGTMELIGAGRGFDGRDLTAGRSPAYLRVAEWLGGVGGDPEDPNNYRITTLSFDVTPYDTLFNVVYRDSLGVQTRYYQNAGPAGDAWPSGQAEDISPNRLAYLGDPDGDGVKEVAVSFYGLNDTLEVIDEVWNADSLRYERTVREKVAVAGRPVMRIIELNDVLDTAAEGPGAELPSGYALSAAYPNPFNPATAFTFTLPFDQTVSVRVYDVMGRLVKTLVDGQRYAQGTHALRWDATNDAGTTVASGTYLLSLEYGTSRLSRVMAFVK